MSDHEGDALDAFRRLDGPAELDEGVEDRIEAAMLARFDEMARSSTFDRSRVVELESDVTRTERTRSRTVRMAAMTLAAAAALVAVVAGLVVVLERDRPTPAVPADTTTVTTPATARIDRQLDAFCATSIAALLEADDRWSPDGLPTESRGLVIAEIEQTAQAMTELEAPLGDRLAELSLELVEAASEARLATTLARPEGDQSVIAARDLALSAPAVSGVTPVPPSCAPGDDGS